MGFGGLSGALACCEWRAAAPGLKPLRLLRVPAAKISNKFSRESPYIWNTFSREFPRFQTGFRVSKRSPRHSEVPGKPEKFGDPNILSMICSVSANSCLPFFWNRHTSVFMTSHSASLITYDWEQGYIYNIRIYHIHIYIIYITLLGILKCQ